MGAGAELTTQLLELLHIKDLGVIGELFDKLALVSVVTSLVLALLQCFLGYRLLRGWIALVGFLVGFFGGLILAAKFGATGYIPLIIGIIAGILLSIVAFKIYQLGVFIYCGALAFNATRLIPFPAEGNIWPKVAIVVGILAFILAGFLAAKYAKPCIIGITAISGASSAAQLIPKLSPEFAEKPETATFLFAGLIAAGVLVQVLTNRRR